MDRPGGDRELREITRYRGKLVQLRTSCKEQVHGVLAKLGIEVTCRGIFGAWGTQWLDVLVLPAISWKVASLRQLTGWLSAEIAVHEQVADLLAGHDAYRAVQQLPGGRAGARSRWGAGMATSPASGARPGCARRPG